MPKTILVRFTRALSSTSILRRSQRAKGTQKYILENYGRVLSGPKGIHWMSEKAMIALEEIFEIYEKGVIEIGELKRAWGTQGDLEV